VARALALAAVLLAACTGAEARPGFAGALPSAGGLGGPSRPPIPEKRGGPLKVVTTTTDLKALVQVVGGDAVEVESLAPPLQDPHTVDVKPGQLARLKTAALLVRIGLDHEPWLPRALRTLGDPRFVPGSPHYLDTSRSVRVLQAEAPRVRQGSGTGHVHGYGNTHYWLDPEHGRAMTAAIAESLARLAPIHAARFDVHRRHFLSRLDAGLGRWSEVLAPYRGARVVVVHDTWPYFAARFGLVVAAAVEPTPGVPPSPVHLADLAERMRAGGIRVIVAEPSSNAAVVNSLAARAGARAITLVPSVGGDPGAGDYISLFDLNVRRLAEALR
jgi:ABC-type Zn uptake system ZnuABC Zn-binding protein ZnuA